LIVCSNIAGRSVNFGRRRVGRMVRGGGLMKQAIFNKSLLQYLACPLSKEPLRYLLRDCGPPCHIRVGIW
jgi:hypothetical protein